MIDLPQSIIGSSYTSRSAVVLTQKNSVIQTDHDKFLLVVCNTGSHVVCCVINSNTYSFIDECDQVAITPSDLQALDHKSYVDCSSVRMIAIDTFRENIDRDIFKPKGHLGDVAMAHVLRSGQNSRKLKKFEKDFFK